MVTTKAKLDEVLMDKYVPELFRDRSLSKEPFPKARAETQD